MYLFMRIILNFLFSFFKYFWVLCELKFLNRDLGKLNLKVILLFVNDFFMFWFLYK